MPWILLFTLLFVAARPLMPLYSFDQQAYFVHGLAKANIGTLANDWYANTPVTYPVFTEMVYWTSHFLHEGLFYVFFILLAGVYLFCLLEIPAHIFKIPRKSPAYFISALSIIILHSNTLQGLAVTYAPYLYPRLFFYGLGQQYLIHYELLPGSFGVFLLLSMLCFLKNKPTYAAISIAICVTFHVAMMVPALCLLSGYCLVYWKENKKKNALKLSALTIALLSPSIVHSLIYVLNPPSTEIAEKSYAILRYVKTPDSQAPLTWYWYEVLVKLSTIFTSIFFIIKHRIATVILSMTGISILLSILQVISNSNFLALLVPWRSAAVLMPLSLPIIIFKTSKQLSFQSIKSKGLLLTLSIAVVLLSISGIKESRQRFHYRANPNPLDQAFLYLRKNPMPGLTLVIPPEFEHVRLYANTSIFVDFGGFPKGGNEVIEWDRRMKIAKHFYASTRLKDRINMLNDISKKNDATHILLANEDPLIKGRLVSTDYVNEEVGIYEINAVINTFNEATDTDSTHKVKMRYKSR